MQHLPDLIGQPHGIRLDRFVAAAWGAAVEFTLNFFGYLPRLSRPQHPLPHRNDLLLPFAYLLVLDWRRRPHRAAITLNFPLSGDLPRSWEIAQGIPWLQLREHLLKGSIDHPWLPSISFDNLRLPERDSCNTCGGLHR